MSGTYCTGTKLLTAYLDSTQSKESSTIPPSVCALARSSRLAILHCSSSSSRTSSTELFGLQALHLRANCFEFNTEMCQLRQDTYIITSSDHLRSTQSSCR